MSAPHELTALQQGRALRAGEVSATELARHTLERIAALDGELHAFVTVTEELALAQAAAADRALRERGRRLGPLHGVPIAIKDVARIEDVPCTQGSALLADEVSDLDDHVVARIKAAGMVIVGTTNTPELALPCYTENRLGPPTRNPWSPQHSPGGSSGGSAAAVAARLVALAHGTDAGGSVRIPASACGVVGLKPSRGRVSNGPIAHDVSGLSVHGALARDSADAAALVQAMAGAMPGDAYGCAGDLRAADPRGLRIVAMPEPMVPDVDAHPDCLAAVARAIALLEAAGHAVDVVEMSPDQGVADAFAQVWSVHAARQELGDEDADEAELMPFTRYLRERGRAISGVELHAALSAFRGVGQMLADMFFAGYDAILTPTLAQPPAPLGAFTSDADEAVNYARMSALMPYTPLHNIAGLPAISVPLAVSDEGLPIGVMLGGRHGAEATVVALAAALEEAAAPAAAAPPAALLG